VTLGYDLLGRLTLVEGLPDYLSPRG